MAFITNERSDAREIDVDGESVVVAPGAVVEVPDELAGRPPSDGDPGEGLLAQPDNWKKASKAKAKQAEKADELVEVPEIEEQN